MGRKVKLSDVKLFEVFMHNGFKWVKLTNGICLINFGHITAPSANHIVEVIGRMEFKPELNEIEKDLVGGLEDFANFLKTRP